MGARGLVGCGALADGPAECSFLRFLVLEADVAVVAEFAAAGDPFAEGEGAGAGCASARVVRDLDVTEVLGVVLDDGFDVVAVDCQVVEVGEELDVLCAGFCLDAGDDLECVFRREERVLRCAAHRLEENSSANTCDAGSCRGEVLGGEFVLLFRGELVLAVAVEGVEGLAAQALTDAGDNVDVVLELGATSLPGNQAAVAAGHVAGVEVQARELNAGVLDGVLELGYLGVGGDGGFEGPPELDGVKTCCLRGGGALEQGQLRQEDGAVHCVRHRRSFRGGAWIYLPVCFVLALVLGFGFRSVEFRFCFMKSLGKVGV